MVPYFAIDSHHKKNILTSLTSSGPNAPPDNYNPIPDIFIPEKYRDIIPKDPIYVEGRYMIPGSREWFTYMYNLDKSYYPPEDMIQGRNVKGKWAVTHPIYRMDINDIFVKQKIVEKAQQQRIERINLAIVIKEALYHGTTPKHHNYRERMIQSLTNASEAIHTYIPKYLELRAE